MPRGESAMIVVGTRFLRHEDVLIAKFCGRGPDQIHEPARGIRIAFQLQILLSDHIGEDQGPHVLHNGNVFPAPMLAVRDNLAECFDALRAHKLRASLTMLGLTMGVATLITVMTLVQGANVYVEQKIANLGTNVFQIARTPFAVTDFNIVIKALKYRKIELDDMQAIADRCTACEEVGASASSTVRVRYGNKEVTDVNLSGQTANMADIDTRTVERGRYFTPSEAEHRANVCLIGDTLVQQLFLGVDPMGKTMRIGNDEFTVIGTMEKIGSVLGQDQDNFVMVPLSNFLRMQGAHTSLTINVKTSAAEV